LSILPEEPLIQWAKEGRQPGMLLVASSQQPSALDMEVLSQCDVIISHALPTAEGKSAQIGQASFVDGDVERVTMCENARATVSAMRGESAVKA